MHSGLFGSIGLAQRARQLCSGQDVVREALVARRAFLLLLAEDASDRTVRTLSAVADQANIDIRQIGTMHEYGAALGKPDRAAIAILDRGFAQSILEKIDRELSTNSNGGG